MKEEWRNVVGYEGYYLVSNLGRVKSLSRLRKRRSKDVILKQTDNGKGYKFVGLTKNRKSERKYVHRLVLKAFVGECGNKECNHINGIKSDNRLSNLEWVTKSENGKHAYKMGLNKVTDYQKEQTSKANRGSGYGANKLVEDDIIKIRKMRKSGMTYQAISEEFNVCRQSIGYIIRGKTWTHV